MILIGLTGGIACGKSTVAVRMSERYNVTVIDADRVVRDLQRPSMYCTRKIAKQWPQCVSADTGEIDRTALGGIVFSDPQARRALGRIMNGPIFFAMLKEILWYWREGFRGGKPPRLVILDVPLLFETNIYTWFIDGSVVVACSEEEQIVRLAKRNGLSRDAALQRLRTQMPIQEKCRRAGYVLRNDGTWKELDESLDECLEWMRGRSGGRLTRVLFAAAVAVSSVVATLAAVCVKLLL